MTLPVLDFRWSVALAGLLLAAALPAEPLPARLEPHHHVALENAYLRVLEARIPPGSPTLYHRHAAPSVFVQLNTAVGASQELGQPRTGSQMVAAGFARYAAYDEHPLVHRAFTLGTAPSHTLAIELLHPAAELDPTPPAARPGLQLAWAYPRVRLYRLHLRPHQASALPADRCAHLLIDITGPIVADPSRAPHRRELSAEDYAFFEPGTALWVQNRGMGPSDCILLELP